MKRSLYLILFSGLLFLASCESSKTVDEAAEMITDESLMTHIETLSADRFQGRAPATEGEELTVDYLIDQFEQIGVEPGMPDGSFVQEFPLLGQKVDGSAVMLSLKQNGNSIGDFSYTSDFMAWPSNQEESVDLSDAELLYVGYGIQAPEFEWDDYKDADVSGKVLVFKNSDPAYDEELFGGDARLYYGRWSYKFEKAAEMGALGAIIIHTTPTAGYPWAVVSNSWGRERFYLVSEGENESMPAFNGWLTEETSASLFEAAGYDLNEMLEAADDPDFEPMPLNGITLDISLEAEYSNQTAKNVLGVIEGSDPDLMDEYVVFTAHHDHLGITTPVDGDSINNGATDNAAGMSAVLNLANAYKATQDSMRRSALFLFVGAEEVGLLGSKYWAENPTVHPGKVTANFNMDGMQIYGPTEDVVLVGYDRNTITDAFEEHAPMFDREIKPDPRPEQGLFYRSDHFSLASVGIPAIFPNPGREYIEKPDTWNETVDSLRAINYHSVSDEVNEYWDPAGLEKDVRFFYHVSFDVLNLDEMMEWREGDEFKATREEMLSEVSEN